MKEYVKLVENQYYLWGYLRGIDNIALKHVVIKVILPKKNQNKHH